MLELVRHFGINFDVPGVIVNNPAEVAAEGPVHVVGGSGATAAANSAPDRSKVVLGSHEGIRALVEHRR